MAHEGTTHVEEERVRIKCGLGKGGDKFREFDKTYWLPKYETLLIKYYNTLEVQANSISEPTKRRAALMGLASAWKPNETEIRAYVNREYAALYGTDPNSRNQNFTTGDLVPVPGEWRCP
jgi:hypothetical protein